MTHQYFLKQALNIAAQYQGFCAPNPAVGAVLVRNNEVIASGAHRGCGSLHAERDLLSTFTELITGSDDLILYVTLEPCSHFGRTPPCTDSIIEKNIPRVVFAHKDPNPTVSGSGQQVLMAAGVECLEVLVPEIEIFYRAYDFWHQHKRPFVTAKLAISLDEKIAGKAGQPLPITGPLVKQLTHQLRLEHDAILTTAKTILTDDPQLNCRLANKTVAKPVYVLDRQLRVPLTAKLFQTASKVILLHAVEYCEKKSTNKIIYQNVLEKNGQLDWHSVLEAIGQQGMQSLWVEAGGECFTSLFESGFLNEAYIFQSNKKLGVEATPAFVGGRAFCDFVGANTLSDKMGFSEQVKIDKFVLGQDQVWKIIDVE